MITRTQASVADLTMMVGGQGGDGSLTIITLLARLLARRGFQLYQSRDVRSRIKGGPAVAFLRASTSPRRCLDDTVDLAIVFDEEGLRAAAGTVADGSIVVYDSSWGEAPGGSLPDGVEAIGVPFGRLSVRELRRDLFKNSCAFGLATRLLSIPDAEAERIMQNRFRRLPPDALSANLNAVRLGFGFAADNGIADVAGAWHLADATPTPRLLMTGNEAVAFGFAAAGGRFFAGYPITPATEILEWLDRRLPELGGVVVQAEDELAAVNMAIGASLTGTRAMTATSGPGIALMQEAVGHSGAAEIPLVVVDCQRAGPSTGMPTKPEQSDLAMLALGANGDFPRVVLTPSDPTECFELTAAAVNLAEDLQCPVYVALDQAIAQNATTIPPLDLEGLTVSPGRRLDAEELAGLDTYARYEITEDGVSPRTTPGTPGGISLVTGNEHDVWGRVSVDSETRIAMVNKRRRKLQNAVGRLPPGVRFGTENAAVGVIGIGMAAGVLEEAVERLAAAGLPLAGLRPRTIWPVPPDTLDFISRHTRTIVVEHNASGQLAGLLRQAGAAPGRVRSVLRFDGTPFSPADLVGALSSEAST